MRTRVVEAKDAGRRLDRWLRRELPSLPLSGIQKSLRTGHVKLNGKNAGGEQRLAEGDEIQLFLADEDLAPVERVDPLLSKFHTNLRVVYEDTNVLLVDKRPGLIAHPDESEKVNTLLTHVRAYLYQKGEYDPERGFSPALCNRIDRFTGGLVIVARTAEALRAMDAHIREGELDKRYLCAVAGRPTPPEGLLDSFLLQPQGAKRVRVLDYEAPGAKRALTKYKTLDTRGDLSLVACELLTGRTHQIRAQFAAAGHPLLGDGQYGNAAFNARHGYEYQALYAYGLTFRFPPDGGPLDGVAGRSFEAGRVAFAETLFPGAPRP